MKIAIVTGCTKGIGKAITEKLITLGYFVYGIFSSDVESAEMLKTKYNNLFEYYRVDVGNKKEILEFFENLQSKVNSLDVLVNNAGIDLFGKIEDYSIENWEKMINVNLTSVFIFSKQAIQLLRKGTDPVIVNISSRIGELSVIEPEFIPYGVTKAGVTAFTVGLSKELSGIRVNAVIPAPTKTALFDEVFTKEEEEDLVKKGMLASPEETADLAISLIRDSKYNGKILYDTRLTNNSTQ